jgi:DNA-binding winged helix-turn-helix (wHTH) protein/TolB-like protein/Tfp pilus assembly protein PilF
MAEKPEKIYEFGDFRLDISERLLLRDGIPVVVTPKVFDLLGLLVENHGHLMEKEKLIKALWPDSFVEEANLNVNVSTLRRVLGESPAESQFIETVPRRGYRFVAAVSEVEARRITPEPEVFEESALAVPKLSTTPVSAEYPIEGAAQQKHHTRWVLWSAATFTLLFAIFLVAWRFTHRSNNAPIRTIAVLPFHPLSAGYSDAALEIGMADALITRLSNSNQIVVRPTSSVVKYTGSEINTLAAGRELEVDAVLEGTVQRDNNRIRVTVQLLRVNEGAPIWAETFDDYFTNIFAVQDSISEKMADALAMHLSGRDKQLMVKRATENTEAYQLYMQGRYLHFKYKFQEALKFFEAAVEKDPEYPLAYTGLALNYVALATTTSNRQEFTEKALAAANKAVSLDPELDEAHNALGWVKYLGQWDWPGAEQEIQRAIQLNPNNSQAHINYATVLSIQGKHEQALQESQVALRLDPSSGDIYYNYILHLYDARRFDEALAMTKKALQVDPEHPLWRWLIPRILVAQSRFDEAIAELKQRASEDDLKHAAALGYAYARSGRRAEAERVLDAALHRTGKPSNAAIAFIYAGMDDKEHALDWLEKGYQDRDNIVTHLKVEPLFDNLRSEPRFKELLRRMRLD